VEYMGMVKLRSLKEQVGVEVEAEVETEVEVEAVGPEEYFDDNGDKGID
jgi:hypothetical protein